MARGQLVRVLRFGLRCLPLQSGLQHHTVARRDSLKQPTRPFASWHSFLAFPRALLLDLGALLLLLDLE